MKSVDYTHKVQYYETDAMSCVHHSNYIRWFEEARANFMEKLGYSYFEMDNDGVMSPVLSIDIKYKSMARYGDECIITTWAEKYTGTKITFGYEIRDSKTSEIRCTGSSMHCFLTKEGKVVSLRRSFPEMDKTVKAKFFDE